MDLAWPAYSCAVPVEAYRRSMCSPKWGTVFLPGAVFRTLAQPFQAFTRPLQPAGEECPF